MVFAGFIGLLYQSPRTIVTRSLDCDGRSTVIRKEGLGQSGVERIRHEREMLTRLSDVSGVPELAVDELQDPASFLMKDTGGVPLLSSMDPGALEPAALFRFAHDLATVLARVHERHVIHKDVNPNNILVTPDSQRIMLIDFDMATTFAQERPAFTSQREVGGTLPYIAPEQTGRMARPVGHRADLYSLGATLYHLAVGEPPFGSDSDPLQLIHDHLARVPVSPQVANPAIPESLSQIILRLLEKEPDRRYQSAQGLVYDLEVASRRWTEEGLAEAFPLGERDFPPRLSPPSELIGRDAEIARLTAAFDQAIAGEPRGVLLSGPPGVGKTSLANELRRVVTERNGWLVSGKFDQYHKDQKSDAVVQAMGAIGLLLLASAESETDMAALRAQAQKTIGPNAKLLVKAAPQIAPLLVVPIPCEDVGTAPTETEDTDTDPFEEERRLHQAGLDLLKVAASPSRPVVFFIDDLQWGMSTPLNLINLLLTSEKIPGLLVVAAYRDTEVDSTHPLTGMLSTWQSQDLPPEQITVTNLPPDDVEVLVRKMLRLASTPHSLTAMVQDRAKGNPFDTIELINALRRDNILTLGPDGWIWEKATIRRYLGSADVTTLVNTRIDTMPASTIALVETMSLIGDDLPIEVLQVATGISGAELSEQLRPALEDGLLIMESDTELRFAHDKIRQATFARLDPDRARKVQLDLARAFAASSPHQDRAAEHYLAVAEDLTDPTERHLASELMRQAASKQTLTSSNTALTFLDGAIRLLAPDPFDDDCRTAEGEERILLGRIQAARHAALCRLGRVHEADETYRAVCRCFPDAVDLVPTATNQITSMCNRGLNTQATDLGMDLLAQLGVEKPGQNLADIVNAELDDLLRWLETVDRAAVNSYPVCTEPRLLLIAQLLRGMAPPVFFSDPMLAFWLALFSFRIWSTRGPCPAHYGAIGFLPFIILAMRQDYRSAMHLRDVIIESGHAHSFDDHMLVSRFHCLLVEHWFDPVAQDIDKARYIHAGSLKVGDIQTANSVNTIYVAAALETFPTLEAFRTSVESAAQFSQRIGDEFKEAAFLSYLPIIDRLRSVDAAVEDTSPKEAPKNPTMAGFFHTNQALLSVLFADLPGAVDHVEAARVFSPAFYGHYPIVWAQTLHALIRAWQVARADPDKIPVLLTELDQDLAWLRGRAADNPGDFAHLVAWIDAERAAALGNPSDALYAFDKAVATVRQQNRIWHQALIQERAGRYFLERGLGQAGELLLAQSWRAYRFWGATAKTEQLTRSFPEIDSHLVQAPDWTSNVYMTSQNTGDSLADIDLLSVLRASQTLSLETNLNRLQHRIVDVLGSLTGATNVQLLLWNSEYQTWMLSDPDRSGPTGLTQAGEATLLPLSALRFVDRTRTPLLVQDATKDARFSQDPYFAALDQCSLLVVPIQTRGHPLAMLILENRLSSGAMTTSRLDIVELISGQLAISIDNAMAEQFRSVVQRSSDLTLVCNSRNILTYASSASAELLGTSNLVLLGKKVTDLFHVEDRYLLAERLYEAIQGGGTPLESRIVADDGTLRWVEVSFTNLLTDPAVNGVVLRLQDITERRKLETELRHSQKMRSVGVLSSGIAHEINTPVQYVLTNLQFLSHVFDDFSKESQTAGVQGPHDGPTAVAGMVDTETLTQDVPQAIAEALDGVTRVATIVQAMKSFGHPGEEKMVPSDLNEAVENTVLVATNEIRHVADVELDLDEIPLVDCVLGDIKQVLLNVIVNAAHAIAQAQSQDQNHEWGIITIRSRHVDDDVVIEIQDNGTGIDPSIADRVFEQFFTTKEVGVGTGQGLALAYTLVHDRHHGSLTFTSEVGVGTTFRLSLPIRQQPHP